MSTLIENKQISLSADTGVFQYLVSDEVYGRIIANAEEISQRVNNKVITPKSLYDVIHTAGGGGLYPDTANFKTLYVSDLNILGTVLATNVGGTGYSQYNVGDILVGNAQNSLTTLAQGRNGEVLVVDTNSPIGVSWEKINLNEYTYATTADVDAGVDTNMLMTPYTVKYALANASMINSTAANIGNLTVSGTASGFFVTTEVQLFDSTISNLALSPANLETLFSKPLIIGDVRPAAASFTSLNAQYLTVDNPPWPTIETTYASNDEAVAKNINNKSLTPSNIPAIMHDPGQIGTSNVFYDGFFDKITCNLLQVNQTVPWPTLDVLYATNQEAIIKAEGNKALCPRNIPSFMSNPGPIGSQQAAAGTFTALQCDSLVVTNPPWPTIKTVFANNIEALDFTINSKGLSPANVPTIMASPGVIGSVAAGNAYFKAVNCYSIQVGQAIKSSSGGTGNSSYNTGDLLVGVSSTLQKLGVGTDNQVLVADSMATCGMRWTSLGGNVPLATTTAQGTVTLATTNSIKGQTNADLVITQGLIPSVLTAGTIYGNSSATGVFQSLTVSGQMTLSNPLAVINGGTGKSVFLSGDMLIGNNLGGLGTLNIGTEKQILRVVNGSISWANPDSYNYATQSSPGLLTIASNQDTVALSSTTKAVTPAGLQTLLASPPNIGSLNPAGATFTQLNVLGGLSLDPKIVLPVKNGGTGISNFSAGSLLVGNSSGGLTTLSPGAYGQTLMINNSGSLVWSNTSGMQAATTAQSGIVTLATNNDTVLGTATDKVLTPSCTSALFANPPPIGSVSANSGVFTNLKITGALTLTNAVLSTSQGGVGITNYNKGDLLVGNSAGTLNALGAGTDSWVLQSNSASTSGLRWTPTPFPINYMDCGAPTMTSATTIVIPYCYARTSSDTANISINSSRVLDISTTGVSSNGLVGGPILSATLTGTVSFSSGSSMITGNATTFTSDFIAGDVITINGVGYKVTLVYNDTSMSVAAPFQSTQSGKSYCRGGIAPNVNYYMVASFTANSQMIFLSERSTVSLPNTRILPFTCKTNGNSTFYGMRWSESYTRLVPYLAIDTSSISNSPGDFFIEELPETAKIADLRVTLTTTNPSGAAFKVSDYNGLLYDQVAKINAPGITTENVKVSITNTAFKCALTDVSQTSVAIEIIGFY